jgi:sugar/nucleoside kinase (ribokinase family)
VSSATLYSLGNFTIDDIVRWPSGENWMGQPGGNALFAAIGARLWLDSVGLLTRLGCDYPAERLDEIRARGICLGLCPVAARTLHDWALYEAGGARQFVNHINSGKNDEMTLLPDEIPPEHRDGRAYHVAPMPTEQQAGLVEALRRPGRLISLDPHEWWIKGYEVTLERILAQVDFFLPSRVEARQIYGADDPEHAAPALARLGPQVVVIKLGHDGSLVYERAAGRLTHVPIYPVGAQDPTGAGDSYCGGFLAGYLLHQDAVRAAQHGTVSASYVVEAIGALATATPNPDEARARLDYLEAETQVVSSLSPL